MPNLAGAAPEAVVIVDRHLRRAHQLLIAAGNGRRWDALSYGRLGIDPRRDGLTEPVDVLIDAARDCLEALLDHGGDLGPAYVRLWAASDVPLLRRLAVHGWTYRNDVDATAKVAWLRECGWLFDHQLRQEVFQLIKATLGDAAIKVADGLVADAKSDPDAAIYGVNQSFQRLAWMARHAPRLQSAQDAFEQVRAADPDFEERPPHGDQPIWVESGFVPSRPPMTTEALHNLICDSAAAALTELRRCEESCSDRDGPLGEGALFVLGETVRGWPEDGFAVLDAEGGNYPDIVRAVVEGWAASRIDDTTADAIMDRLGSVDLSAVGEEVARLLADGGQSEATPTEWYRRKAGRRLAAKVWAALHEGAADLDVEEWLARAINDPAGRLAQFWLQAVASDWREAGDEWAGLPTATRRQLDVLLTGADERVTMAEVVLSSQMHFWWRADAEWCRRRVLPLLDWAEPERARRTWEGFLFWGRWNDSLLKDGLLAQYEAAAANVGALANDSRRLLCERLAGIALQSEVDPLTDGWVGRFTRSPDISLRTELMNHIAWKLSGLPPEAVEHQWQRWMRQYWKDRLRSVPRKLETEEASAMAQWVVYLTESVHEGVELVTAHSSGLPENSDLLSDLTHGRVAAEPAAFAAMVTHLLRETPVPFYDCYHLRELVQQLRAKPDPINVSGIIEQALRLRCADAPTW